MRSSGEKVIRGENLTEGCVEVWGGGGSDYDEEGGQASWASSPPPPSFADWQPIDTAPKDGTRILLVVTGADCVMIGFWGPKMSMYGVNYGHDWGVGCSWDQNFACPPTHLQPLPAPPATEKP